MAETKVHLRGQVNGSGADDDPLWFNAELVEVVDVPATAKLTMSPEGAVFIGYDRDVVGPEEVFSSYVTYPAWRVVKVETIY